MNRQIYILTYLVAALIAVAFVYVKRRKKRTHFRTVMRVLFHPRIWLSQSSLLDFKYFVAGWFIFPSLFAYTTLSGAWLSRASAEWLARWFGPHQAAAHSHIFLTAAMAVAFYLAYEFAYWLNHYLCHRVRFLWEFHKVHHTATVLTPVTVWRVHLIDTMLFANMVAVAVGLAQGAASYLLGDDIGLAAMAGSNMLLYGFMALYGHLQHSQIWIPFTGAVGHVFFSPAHHQIHHSNHPDHFNKNLGSSLAIFDWMFGTLYMPQRKDQKLLLGVDRGDDLQGFIASTWKPFYSAFKPLIRRRGRTSTGAIRNA